MLLEQPCVAEAFRSAIPLAQEKTKVSEGKEHYELMASSLWHVMEWYMCGVITNGVNNVGPRSRGIIRYHGGFRWSRCD